MMDTIGQMFAGETEGMDERRLNVLQLALLAMANEWDLDALFVEAKYAKIEMERRIEEAHVKMMKG